MMTLLGFLVVMVVELRMVIVSDDCYGDGDPDVALMVIVTLVVLRPVTASVNGD